MSVVYEYDKWLKEQWAKEGEGEIKALNASVTSEEEEEIEEEDVDYQGLLERVKALSASIDISTTTRITSPSSPSKPKNIAALLNLGERMLAIRRT
jgi:hypothetical protein